MISTNTYVAYGRLVADAQSIQSKIGGCKFRIAIDGYKKEDTLFLTCSKWGDSGTKIQSYLLKGKGVIVSGSLKPVKYTNKSTGAEVNSVELTCNTVQLIGGVPMDGDSFNDAVSTSSKAIDNFVDDSDLIPFEPCADKSNKNETFDDEDIPF